MGHDTLGRSSAVLTHTSTLGAGAVVIGTALPQREQTITAREHPGAASVEQATMRDTLNLSASLAKQQDSTRFTNTFNLSPPGSPSAPHRPRTTAVSREDTGRSSPPPGGIPKGWDSPGPQAYNHRAFTDGLPTAAASPKHVLADDHLGRSKRDAIYLQVSPRGLTSVITPQSPRTARARIHPSQPGAFPRPPGSPPRGSSRGGRAPLRVFKPGATT